MFINPMWDNESQRIGKQRCTPVGYALHGVSDLIGFIATICLIGVLIYLTQSVIRGSFHWWMLWVLTVPMAIAIVGKILLGYSWYLADKQGFKYDHEKCISTWVDDAGNRQSYP